MDTDRFLQGLRADRAATEKLCEGLRVQRDALDTQVLALEERLAALDTQLAAVTGSEPMPPLTGLSEAARSDVPLMLAFDQPAGLTREQASAAAEKNGKSPRIVGGWATWDWVVRVGDRRWLTPKAYGWLEEHNIPTPNRAAAEAARDAALANA